MTYQALKETNSRGSFIRAANISLLSKSSLSSPSTSHLFGSLPLKPFNLKGLPEWCTVLSLSLVPARALAGTLHLSLHPTAFTILYSSREMLPAEVKASEPHATVHTIAVDISSAEQLKSALAKADEKLREYNIPVETVLFNAARVGESEVLAFPVEELENDFKIAVSSLYTVSQWIIPRFVELAKGAAYKPSLLVTGGFLYRDPYPPLFSLSAVKAAQYNLVCTLHKTFKKYGVQCAMVLVGGFVSAEAQQCNPKNISEKAWDLYEQGPDIKEIEIVEHDWKSRTKWD